MSVNTPVSIGSSSSASLGAVSTFTLTTTGAISSGDLVVVAAVMSTNNSVSVSSISDGTNSYTKFNTTGIFSGNEVSLWYQKNASAVSSGATITLTFSSAASGSGNAAYILAARIPINEFPLANDVSQIASSASALTVTATTATLAQTDEIAIGCAWIHSGGDTYSGATGFTNVITQPQAGGGPAVIDYQKLSATSAVSYSPTFTAGAAAIGAVVGTFSQPAHNRARSIRNYIEKRFGFAY